MLTKKGQVRSNQRSRVNNCNMVSPSAVEGERVSWEELEEYLVRGSNTMIHNPQSNTTYQIWYNNHFHLSILFLSKLIIKHTGWVDLGIRYGHVKWIQSVTVFRRQVATYSTKKVWLFARPVQKSKSKTGLKLLFPWHQLRSEEWVGVSSFDTIR